MRIVTQEHAASRRRLRARRGGLSLRRRLAGALTGLVVLPLLTLALVQLRGVLDLSSRMLLYLIAVVVVALVGGLLPALAAVVAAAALLARYFIPPVNDSAVADANNVVGLIGFLVVAGAVSSVVGLAARRAREAETLATANAESREELRVLAEEQAALRRVATLVARGVSPAGVFSAVAQEVGRVLGADSTNIVRFDPDGTATVVASIGGQQSDQLLVGTRWKPEAPLATEAVSRTGRPARCDDYGQASGVSRDAIRRLGIRSGVAAPIVVEGRLWGAINVGTRGEHFPADAEQRMADFTELVGTAIANAQSRAELTASRARIVAAADQARRRIERDLHDGIQQRLVSLSLELRLVQATEPADVADIRTQIGGVADELNGVLDELGEISRGIHPAILSEGGLGPALRVLARRAAIPVELNVQTEARSADPIEVAAYYVVSEALTNTAKHGRASRAHVTVEEGDALLHLAIRDDGIGGADPTRGTGLVGLRDRVQALGGSIDVSSRAGEGTLIAVQLPLQPDPPAGPSGDARQYSSGG
ncbi:MAG TPA: GAF domain-containing sensor histidine kinase [Pseudonocardiaceae bacterium]|nr:GAF domain-containing sensor histidine kinase [Pseudonocardiaceae bacterium]